MKFKNRCLLIAVTVIGGSLLVSCTDNKQLLVINKVYDSKKEEQKNTHKVDDKKVQELSSSQDNLDTETNLYGTKEVQIREEIESYIRTLQEGKRYVIKYEEESGLGERALVTGASGHRPTTVETVEELTEKLKDLDMDFYIPAYIPEGFELAKIDIGYYTPYDEANISAEPIKVRKIESQEGIIVEVYSIQENYKKNIAGIYLEYNDGNRTIRYSFGLSVSSGYNKEPYTQFVKEEFDMTYLEKDNLKIHQKIIPIEYYTGLDLDEGEASPSCFQSIMMEIQGESSQQGIQQEEFVKIANSIYKVN